MKQNQKSLYQHATNKFNKCKPGFVHNSDFVLENIASSVHFTQKINNLNFILKKKH